MELVRFRRSHRLDVTLRSEDLRLLGSTHELSGRRDGGQTNTHKQSVCARGVPGMWDHSCARPEGAREVRGLSAHRC